MSARLEHFSVQAVGTDGRPVEGSCTAVDARSPIHAAELVLGTTLAAHGKMEHAKAMVWRMGEDFQPISTTLYCAE